MPCLKNSYDMSFRECSLSHSLSLSLDSNTLITQFDTFRSRRPRELVSLLASLPPFHLPQGLSHANPHNVMSTTFGEKPQRPARASSFLRRSSFGPSTHIHFDDPDTSLALSLSSSDGGRPRSSQWKKTYRPTTSLWTSSPLIRSDSCKTSPKRSELSFGSESSAPGTPTADGSLDGRHSTLSAAGDGEMERNGSQKRSQLLRRTNRPNSIFGSLRSLKMSDFNEDGMTTPPTSGGSGMTPSFTWGLFGTEETGMSYKLLQRI